MACLALAGLLVAFVPATARSAEPEAKPSGGSETPAPPAEAPTVASLDKRLKQAVASNSFAEAAAAQIHIREAAVPVGEEVRGACEILGFDPLYVANEGRFACFTPEADAERALRILRSHPLGNDAARIGTVTQKASGLVTLESRIGATRIVDMLSGEQLPRIC